MLRDLYLGGNLFREIPRVLLEMTNLRELSIGNCNIESVPPEIANLSYVVHTSGLVIKRSVFETKWLVVGMNIELIINNSLYSTGVWKFCI